MYLEQTITLTQRKHLVTVYRPAWSGGLRPVGVVKYRSVAPDDYMYGIDVDSTQVTLAGHGHGARAVPTRAFGPYGAMVRGGLDTF